MKDFGSNMLYPILYNNVGSVTFKIINEVKISRTWVVREGVILKPVLQVGMVEHLDGSTPMMDRLAGVQSCASLSLIDGVCNDTFIR